MKRLKSKMKSNTAFNLSEFIGGNCLLLLKKYWAHFGFEIFFYRHSLIALAFVVVILGKRIKKNEIFTLLPYTEFSAGLHLILSLPLWLLLTHSFFSLSFFLFFMSVYFSIRAHTLSHSQIHSKILKQIHTCIRKLRFGKL